MTAHPRVESTEHGFDVGQPIPTQRMELRIGHSIVEMHEAVSISSHSSEQLAVCRVENTASAKPFGYFPVLCGGVAEPFRQHMPSDPVRVFSEK